MGNVGPGELITGLLGVSIPLIGVFILGFFIGKGVGFKEGLRETKRQ